jgi:AcrR family transcriptional regulator
MTNTDVSKGERTRSQIIESAYILFLEQGYHGTSMRDIAQSAGIALSGTYNYFKSKDDIFYGVLMSHHPYLSIVPAMSSAQGKSIAEFVGDAAHRMVAAMNNRPEFLKLMFIELVEFNGKHLTTIFDEVYPQVAGFAQGLNQLDGRLRDIPYPIIIRAFIGLFFSYVLTELLIAEKLPPEMRIDSLDHFIDIYLHGILARD